MPYFCYLYSRTALIYKKQKNKSTYAIDDGVGCSSLYFYRAKTDEIALSAFAS